MAGWAERVSSKKNSSNEAKDRLRLVLIHDRTDITPEAMESLKNEILEVISRYVEIDSTAVKINMAQDGREQRLIADIPIRPSSQRRRIG